MSKGVRIIPHEEGDISIELHIVVENGVNIATVCRSIMSEVKYVVTRIPGWRSARSMCAWTPLPCKHPAKGVTKR